VSDPTPSLAPHEPSLHTVEMVCERLAEMGVAVGLDTARDLVCAVLAAEAPRVDARLREALDTALETIRVAAQAAMGVLATTSPSAPRPQPEPAAPRREKPAPKRPRNDFEDDDRRPVFRRPRGR
jgi:hypothetical protein